MGVCQSEASATCDFHFAFVIEVLASIK